MLLIKNVRLPLLALFLAMLAACGGPAREVAVDLPFPKATAHFESWRDWEEYWHELVVKNERGEIRMRMWTEWGPPTRANLYVTSDDIFVVIGAHGCCYAVKIYKEKAPRIADLLEYRDADSSKWIYLGSVSRGAFFRPDERQECIANYGVDGGRHRAKYQVPGEC